MPRLSKIRLTGCKYDGFKKEHENSIFDLNRNEKADHTLFTLCNGGGKGVMMQLIFQLLLPETRWGKNNGNKVISMFYDQRNNLYPFTFHVALEWILDTVPEKRLITGIAVKAIIKNTSNEEEEKTGLTYFLYTHEHSNNGYYTLENLPLYNKVTGEAVDIDVLEDFINGTTAFRKYSQSQVRRSDAEYYRYLESLGIYRSEWINLKDINKLEGGSGDYFVGASDNKAIFDKIIIPAIGENIKNYTYDDGNNLIEMFRSNLSITKDLPVLMKREEDYKDLLIQIKPLIENADSGSRFIDIKDRLIGEGNDMYFILKDEALLVENEIKKWDNEYEKSKVEKESLSYKKDNLVYNQQKREIETGEKEEELFRIAMEHKVSEIELKEEEKRLYQVNEILCHKKETEDKISSKTLEKSRIIEVLDISDIKARAEEVDYEIELEWEKTQKLWSDIKNQKIGYMNYTNQMKENNLNERNKYSHSVGDLQQKVHLFTIKEQAFNKKRKVLEDIYGSFRLQFPERIEEDLYKEQEETESKIGFLVEELEDYNEKIYTLDREMDELKIILNNNKTDHDLLQNKIKMQEKDERELSRKISKQLLENQNASLITPHYLKESLEKLTHMKLDKETKLESLQKAVWEKNIDRLLNKADYFIPNKDIPLIKEEINRLGIHVETGFEYMKGLRQEEKEGIVNINPEFVYGLVIGSQRDWEVIEKNIRKDLFINNMVPIYIQADAGLRATEQFRVVHGKAYGFLDNHTYEHWKASMEDEIEGLLQTEKNIKSDLTEINGVIQEVYTMQTKDTALVLIQKLKEKEAQIEEIAEEIRLKAVQTSHIKTNLGSIKSDLEKNKDSLESLRNSIQQIKTYIEDVRDLEIDRISTKKIEKDIQELKDKILQINEDNERILDYQDSVERSYNRWELRIQNVFDNLKKVWEEATYDDVFNHTYMSREIPEFIIGDDELTPLISEKRALKEEFSAKNSNVASLETELQYLDKEHSAHIKNLKKLDENWTKYEHLRLPLDEISIRIKELERNLKNLKDEESNIKSKRDRMSGSLKIMKEQLEAKAENILDVHKKAPVVLEVEDIFSEMNRVNQHIQSNKNYLSFCYDELQKNKNKKANLEINLTKVKNGYPLELTKGKMDKLLKGRLEDNPDQVVENWLERCSKNKVQIQKTVDEGERFKAKFIDVINSKLEENKLREKIYFAVKESNVDNFKNNLTSFSSMEIHFQNELSRLSKDKSKAEEAMKQWSSRASIHVIRMIEALKSMVASMNYTNEQGYAFPLVKLKGVERLPKEEAEIAYLLDEYFIQSISDILEKNVDIMNIEDKELKRLMGDRAIFSKALQGRYPTLLVYKMSEKNEFRYARARDEYYTTWEAINKGEGDLPEGSGGQTLSVNTFVIMMIMSFKKKHIGNENPSTVLILDNPFGKASAKHVLDPIFEIADKLNFQLICFAAPEIIKVEISERFPVFWELKIEEGKVVHGGRIIK